MPAPPDTPEPLRSTINDMEAAVMSARDSLIFASPEMRLLERLAGIIEGAFLEAVGL